MSLQDSINDLAKDAIKKYVKPGQVIGLGSGSTAAVIVREMAELDFKDSLLCIPTSLQIKVEAEKSGLQFGDESRIPDIDVVFDGADQIDEDYYMIKGGGGALLREKILITSAKIVVIAADLAKFVKSFARSVPIEVHPLARVSVTRTLMDLGGKPVLRTLQKGYPFITENGNMIIDTTFTSITDVPQMEKDLKCIAGVMEVGLFTRRANVYYRAKSDSTFDIVRL